MGGFNPGLESAAKCQIIFLVVRAVQYLDFVSVYISENLINGKIQNGKIQGPDSIHPRILKESAEVIALPLSLIFRSSLSSGMIPEKWKWAHITPVFKKGSKNDKENYR